LERAHKVRAKAFGPEHFATIQTAISLAALLGKLGDRKSAETVLQHNRQVVEKEYGKQHPAYADAIFNLAGAHLDAGHYEQAEQGYREALPLFENILGKGHP